MLTITIDDYDRFPRLAREAIANSIIIGNGDHRLRVKRAKASVMAERIRRADAMLAKGDNMAMPGGNLRAINAVLSGDDR